MHSIVFYIFATLFIFTPLVFSHVSSELFEFPKMLLLYLGAGMLLPLIAVKILQKRPNINKNRSSLFIFIAFLIFLSSQTISTLFSIDKHVSLFGYYSRFNGGLFSILAYFIFFIAIFLYIKKQDVNKLLKISLLGAFLVALWGLPSRFGHDLICLISRQSFDIACWTDDFNPTQRLFSTLGQPNWMAAYLLVQIFIVLYFLSAKHKIFNKLNTSLNSFFLILLFLLFSTELLWTNSRSGILAYTILVLVYLIVWFFSYNKKQTSLKELVNLFIVFVLYLVFSGVYLFPMVIAKINFSLPQNKTSPEKISEMLATEIYSKPVNQAPATITESTITPSSKIRLIVWRGALELAKKYPLFGTGVETFAYSYYFTRPAEHNLTSEWNFVYNKAHNEILNYLATTGYIGVLSYLLLFFAFLFPALKEFLSRSFHMGFSLAYLCILGSIFITNFFGFSTTSINLFFYTLPALLLVKMTKQENEDKDYKFALPHFVIFAFYLLFLITYLTNYFYADYNFARAKEQKQLQNLQESYSLNQKAIELRKEPVYLDQHALLSANIASAFKLQKQLQEAERFAKQAIELNNKTIKSSPKNVFYWKTAAQIYYLLSITFLENERLSNEYFLKAVEALEKANSLAPTDPKILYAYAAILAEPQPEQARQLLQKALELKPNYQEAQMLLQSITKK